MSVIFHVFVLAAVAYGFRLTAVETKNVEKSYIEVDLGKAPTTGQAMDMKAEAKEPEPVAQQQIVAAVSQTKQPIPILASAAEDGPQVQVTESGVTGTASATATSTVGTVSAGSLTGVKPAGVSGHGSKGGSDRPYVIYGPTPQYPQDARTNGWEGTVRVKVLINESGAVQDIRLANSSGYGSLDQAALDGVCRWRFKPACHEGSPIVAWVTVPVIFELN
ncbi:MAG: hypothetical protein H6Q65_933 [Firmicutes bacterium]|nr:hypothetical protein [Bacillota bacterium]